MTRGAVILSPTFLTILPAESQAILSTLNLKCA
jgi:hypothetical protein